MVLLAKNNQIGASQKLVFFSITLEKNECQTDGFFGCFLSYFWYFSEISVFLYIYVFFLPKTPQNYLFKYWCFLVVLFGCFFQKNTLLTTMAPLSDFCQHAPHPDIIGAIWWFFLLTRCLYYIVEIFVWLFLKFTSFTWTTFLKNKINENIMFFLVFVIFLDREYSRREKG